MRTSITLVAAATPTRSPTMPQEESPPARRPLRIHLITGLVGVAISGWVASMAAPTLRSRWKPAPGQAERRAIQRAIQFHNQDYRTRYGQTPRPPDVIEASPMGDGSWIVKWTDILNPEPGGYRTTFTFRVDEQGACTSLGLSAGGTY